MLPVLIQAFCLPKPVCEFTRLLGHYHFLITGRDKPAPVIPSLQTIPTEMRLQIFGCLLPESLPLCLDSARPSCEYQNNRLSQQGKAARQVYSAFRSLMLTSRLINVEATELFFKSTLVRFNLSHDDDKKSWHPKGLKGFDLLWQPGRLQEIQPVRMEVAKSAVLDDFCEKFES